MTSTDADHLRGPVRPGDGAEPSPLDLGPDRVNELQRVYEQAREAYWSDETGHPGSLEEAHEVGLRAIADALAPPAAPGAAAATLDADLIAFLTDFGDQCCRRDTSPFGDIGCVIEAPTVDLVLRAQVLRGRLVGCADAAPASALPGAEAVAEALFYASTWTNKEVVWAEAVKDRTTISAGIVRHFREMADRVLARLARPDAPAGPGLAGAVRDEAVFLLDRLTELGDDSFTEDGNRDFYGHVSPSMWRLRKLLLDAALDGGAGDGWRHHRTPAQVYRAAKADGLRAALGLVEGEQTQRDAKGTPNRRLLQMIGDRLREQIEAVERDPDEDQNAPPRSGQRGGDDAQG